LYVFHLAPPPCLFKTEKRFGLISTPKLFY